jgi:uncharacterized protein
MRWRTGDRGNIQDVRGRSGGMGVPLGIGGMLVLLVGSWLTGVNLFSLVDSGAGTSSDTSVSRPVETSPKEEQLIDLVDAVAGDIQKTWAQLLPQQYQTTQVSVFRDSVQSTCGRAGSASGPFYCPGDRMVYLDLSFFDELSQRFKAPGDFAQAYVIAHEIGHHVQNLTGTLEAASPDGRSNARSVQVELQADCYAGIWGHQAAKSGNFSAGRVELDPGDAEEALNAAAAIGDDRLSKGRIGPESFTHGSSAQRVAWFKRGMDTGDPSACDTFNSR